jgi:excinuclease ABC subunit C
MFDIKAFLSSAPEHPGVYQMLDEQGVVLYVGKAKNLKKRLSSYFSTAQKDPKTLALVKHIKNIDITIARSENEALILECNLIKKLKPRYNILFRDDKTYPYILITNEEPYPRIDFYRGPVKKDGRYFGPYPSSAAVRETIHLIQKVFQLRTCSDNFFASRTRPCLHHQIGLCSGPCVGLIAAEEYQANVRHTILFLEGKNELIVDELNRKMELAAKNLNFELAARVRDQIAKIREIQERQYVSSGKGDADIIGFAASSGIVCIQLLAIRAGRILGSRAHFPVAPPNSSTEEIITAFITQHYLGQQIHELPKEIILDTVLSEHDWLVNALSEQAQHKILIASSVRGERKKWLEMATTTAKQSVASQLANKTNTKDRLAALQALLSLKKPPRRIECFDISHTMGEATVASCVVYDSNGPAKSDYRRFNISGITPGDDIAAMTQALTRRYKRLQAEEQKFPDVLLIDGGIAQLHAAEKVMAELEITEIILVGVAKGITRKPGYETLHIPGQYPINLEPDSLALHLIQQIRDEAHRFAITGHRLRRDKTRRTSTLESIPGIGAKRRRELLRYFGGIQALNRASLDELAKVPGISQSLAQRIFEALHNVAV